MRKKESKNSDTKTKAVSKNDESMIIANEIKSKQEMHIEFLKSLLNVQIPTNPTPPPTLIQQQSMENKNFNQYQNQIQQTKYNNNFQYNNNNNNINTNNNLISNNNIQSNINLGASDNNIFSIFSNTNIDENTNNQNSNFDPFHHNTIQSNNNENINNHQYDTFGFNSNNEITFGNNFGDEFNLLPREENFENVFIDFINCYASLDHQEKSNNLRRIIKTSTQKRLESLSELSNLIATECNCSQSNQYSNKIAVCNCKDCIYKKELSQLDSFYRDWYPEIN